MVRLLAKPELRSLEVSDTPTARAVPVGKTSVEDLVTVDDVVAEMPSEGIEVFCKYLEQQTAHHATANGNKDHATPVFQAIVKEFLNLDAMKGFSNESTRGSSGVGRASIGHVPAESDSKLLGHMYNNYKNGIHPSFSNFVDLLEREHYTVSQVEFLSSERNSSLSGRVSFSRHKGVCAVSISRKFAKPVPSEFFPGITQGPSTATGPTTATGGVLSVSEEKSVTVVIQFSLLSESFLGSLVHKPQPKLLMENYTFIWKKGDDLNRDSNNNNSDSAHSKITINSALGPQFRNTVVLDWDSLKNVLNRVNYITTHRLCGLLQEETPEERLEHWRILVHRHIDTTGLLEHEWKGLSELQVQLRFSLETPSMQKESPPSIIIKAETIVVSNNEDTPLSLTKKGETILGSPKTPKKDEKCRLSIDFATHIPKARENKRLQFSFRLPSPSLERLPDILDETELDSIGLFSRNITENEIGNIGCCCCINHFEVETKKIPWKMLTELDTQIPQQVPTPLVGATVTQGYWAWERKKSEQKSERCAQSYHDDGLGPEISAVSTWPADWPDSDQYSPFRITGAVMTRDTNPFLDTETASYTKVLTLTQACCIGGLCFFPICIPGLRKSLFSFVISVGQLAQRSFSRLLLK